MLVDIAGWYGVLAILGAYVLVSFGILAVDSSPYRMLNLTGAIALGVESWVKRDTQPAVLNLIWALVALLGLLS